MKWKYFTIMALAFSAGLLEMCWAIENPAIRSPVGSGRLPASLRSGLIRSPSAIDPSGNLVITGNVAGGRHFRGVVPYNAVTDIGAPTGTSFLDSFLRYSADTGDFSSNGSRLRPWFSQARTVSGTIPGTRGAVLSPLAQRDGQSGEGYAIPSFGDQRPSSHSAGMFRSSDRPMSMTQAELERAISAEMGTYTGVRGLADLRARARLEGIPDVELRKWEAGRPDLGLRQVEEETAALKKSLDQADESLNLGRSEMGKTDIRRAFELKGPTVEPVLSETSEDTLDLGARDSKMLENREKGPLDRLDVDERMKKRISDLRDSRVAERQRREELEKSAKQLLEAARGDYGAGALERGIGAAPGEKESGEETGAVDLPSAEREVWSYQTRGRRTEGGDSSLTEMLSESDLAVGDLEKERGSLRTSIRAKTILGSHKDFASFAAAKFNQHMRAAEEYLKQGRYYRAADVYSLALIYKPGDPLAYAGKSHALFAAGEYMSSALFLSRALEIFPEYVQFKVDFEALLSDKEKLESRLAEIQEWRQRSNSGELQFLLAYVFYQMGELDRAREAINGAYERMPDAPAVVTLKKAIEGRPISENKLRAKPGRGQSPDGVSNEKK